MKILVFVPYYPPHIGGVESYASELDARLAGSGHAITVFAPRIPHTAPRTETITGVEVLRYPAFEIIPNYPLPRFWNRDFFLLSRRLRQQRFNIVLSHTRFFFSSLLALRFSKSNNIPLIHIEHGSSFVQHSHLFISTTAYLYDQLIGKYILKKAARVVAISDSVRAFVEKLTHGQVQPTLIYRGFDWRLSETILSDDSKWPIQDKATPRIIYIGRLISGKGVTDLISALGLIKDKSWQCLIVGDGPERKHLQSLCKKLGIADKIVFLGTLPHEKALSILKSADIFVNPSYSEGLPTTIIEAAIFSKAIIATDVGGTSEIITDGTSGLLIPAHDAIKLSDALNKLASDKPYRLLLEEMAHEKNKDRFDWDVCIRNFEGIFNTRK